MNIKQIPLLEKIISIQSLIIRGDSIRSILRKEASFFNKESGSHVIAVCIENEDRVNIELVLEEREHFLSLMDKYKVLPKHLELNKFIEQCNLQFCASQERVQINTLHDIFDGNLSKKKTISFEQEISFNHALLYIMRNDIGRKIGFVIYLFPNESEQENDKLLELTKVFEMLLRPFYDEDRKVLRAKCVQMDEKMQRLTEQEKRIAKFIIQGKPYKEIAENLGVSINTLKTHTKNIFSKYGVSSKIDLHNKLTGAFQ
ncbi:MAG: LuxR C-terminal-related transcriptional regulator [Campylobacterota bacterium]